MSYAFYDRDLITNRGEQDFTAAHYEALLALCSSLCTSFSLAVTVNSRVIQQLAPFEIPRFESGNYRLTSKECRKFYRLCSESMEIFSQITDSFWNFNAWFSESMPEDPAFFREDGSLFLECIAHEGECYMYPYDYEDISQVLAHGGWIKMIGGAPLSIGTPSAPAEEHQIPPDSRWNLAQDPLFLLLCDLTKHPDEYLESMDFSKLYAYICGFQKGMAASNKTSIQFWNQFICKPEWYCGLELYILGRLHMNTDTSLPKAYSQAGYSDEESFHQFFSNLMNYLSVDIKTYT